MSSPVEQAPATDQPPTAADVVGNAFVLQYYRILEQSPEHVHRFYQDTSKLGRPEDNGIMSITTTMDAINLKILDYGKLSANIITVDSQESYNGGVFVLVTGYLTGKDNLTKKFTQSFFLAPQDKGYFVLNDVFRYVDDFPNQNGDDGSIDVEWPVTPEHVADTSDLQDNHVSEPVTAVSEDVGEEEVYNPPEKVENSIEEEEAPLPEIVDEIPHDSQMVAESNSKIEEAPKKSYASIVKVMKESPAPFSNPAPASLRSVPKKQEQQVTVAPTSAPVSEAVVSSTNDKENGINPEAEAEGHSIYIKGLPMNATAPLIENEFKKFGPIKNNGVQVRNQKGFCFGFVEFEVASAVQSAIEASPVMISGRQVFVEEKRSTNRGNNRGRFPSGRGNGYRNEYRNEGPRGPRGGGYGGGRGGYGRSDFNFKGEFGGRSSNRGGSSSRGGGGDGYQRSDNAGRVPRAVGLALNAAAKSTAPRVSASA